MLVSGVETYQPMKTHDYWFSSAVAVTLTMRPSWAQPLHYEARDVVEGESLRLTCHFNPALASRHILYFWYRSTRDSRENAAIGDSPLDPHYSVDYFPNEGRYDLIISRAQYEKDNGPFECTLKEVGSGADVHTYAYKVTVLSESWLFRTRCMSVYKRILYPIEKNL